MKKKTIAVLVLTLVVVGISYRYYKRSHSPRAEAIQVAKLLNQALETNDADILLELISLPPAYAGRTDAEKIEFLTKALRNEISEEGLRRLMKNGEFGALLDVFPETGNEWAGKAGVDAGDCVAFRLEGNGIRSELVICTNTTPNRIVRANNIR